MNAFLVQGHDAWSCDLAAAETATNRHIRGDVRDVMAWEEWDLLCVMHPPCTRLCNSGVRWLSVPPPGRSLAEMWAELEEGAALFSACWNTSIPRVAVENPVMHKHAKERIIGYVPPAQSVQPWQFGTSDDGPDNERKRTCFWLRGLPKLKPTGTLDGSTARDSVHKASPGANRGVDRSRFFPGLAAAMPRQWGDAAVLLSRQVA